MSLSSGPNSQSIVIGELRDMSRKISIVFATRTPWTPYLVIAPDPRRRAMAVWGLSENACSMTVLSKSAFFCVGGATDFDKLKIV